MLRPTHRRSLTFLPPYIDPPWGASAPTYGSEIFRSAQRRKGFLLRDFTGAIRWWLQWTMTTNLLGFLFVNKKNISCITIERKKMLIFEYSNIEKIYRYSYSFECFIAIFVFVRMYTPGIRIRSNVYPVYSYSFECQIMIFVFVRR